MLHKNTGPTPIGVSGQMVPVGGPIDVDPDDPEVAEHVAFGRLTAYQGDEITDAPPSSSTARPGRQQTTAPEES